MRLGALTRAATRLKTLLVAPGVTPFVLYLEFVSLLADLSAFSPDSDVLADCAYEHDNLLPVFAALHARIKSSLKATTPASSLRVDFKKTDACYSAQLSEAHLKNPSEYYLVIRTKQESRVVTELVEDRNRFKLMPPSQLGAARYGIELKREEIPPPHLNVPRGALLFRLVRSSNPERWKSIEDEKSITAFWREHRASDFELVLQMTLPA